MTIVTTLKTLTLSLFTLTTLSCMDTNTREKRIKRDSPPENFFEGKDLKMAQAIYKGDVTAIESLIKNDHFDINKRGTKFRNSKDELPFRYTFLGYAVKIGELKGAEKLLELGANPDLINDERGVYFGNINLACDHKNKEMIYLLVKYKANLNPPLEDSPLGNLLIGDIDKELIDLLLANGANINHQGYIGGDTAIIKALNTDKFDYVKYFLDKGANPTVIDYVGNSLAYLIQKELEEGRLADYGLKEYNGLKSRMVSQYHVQYPLKNEYKKGLEESIKRYESLSQKDKDFLGNDEIERMDLFKKWLKNGITDDGLKLE